MQLEKKWIGMTAVAIMASVALIASFSSQSETEVQSDLLPSADSMFAEAQMRDMHSIQMEAVKMPDDMYAYRMVSYTINGGDELVGKVYSDKPSIPGPTIIMNEGDEARVSLINSACEDNFVDGPTSPLDALVGPLPTYSETSLVGIHVHGVHYDITDDASYSRSNMANTGAAGCGQTIEYTWVASAGTAGAWPYHDHTFTVNEVGAEELGLFGTLIVNPQNGRANGLVSETGDVTSVDIDDIEKEFVLWMVTSPVLGDRIFYGSEVDHATTDYSGADGWRETALWTNPNLVTNEGGIYRVHVIGLGEETHSFHMHGHRWTDDIHEGSAIEDVIDVKEIAPLQRHTLLIKASDNDDADITNGKEGWMYHCHVSDHMKVGMSGMMIVVPGDVDDVPAVGATFTLSDEPGVWFKTIDAGVGDRLDNYLKDVVGLPIDAKNGTGYPLSYASDAMEAAIPGAGTHFSGSEGRSLAVISPGETVNFVMKDSQTKHTITTLIYPTAASPIGGNGNLRVAGLGHFDHQLGIRGSTLLTDTDGSPVGLDVPGLYVFVCKIHPYMLGAVIVDDPNTNLYIAGNPDLAFPLLDLSGDLTVLTRTGNVDPAVLDFPTKVPPTHPLALDLLKTFYVITDPNNWKDYTLSSWNVALPPVLATTNTEEVVAALAYDTPTTLLAAGLLGLTNSTGQVPATVVGLGLDSSVPITAADRSPPNSMGVGEVWVNTQFEETAAKNHNGTSDDKPGTITVVDTSDWSVERKISLPEINMNNPHNMWSDTKNDVIYQTQWFGSDMAIIDRESGELIKEVFVGQSPSHVIVAPDTGKIYTATNGEETVNEFDSTTYDMTRQISTGFRSHPHGHWMSSSGQYVVTPDFIGLKASIIDLDSSTVSTANKPLYAPIATGFKGDESVFYTSDFLGNSMTAIDPSDGSVLGHIDWLEHGVIGLPIQNPVSPDDKWMVVALTLGSKIGVVDLENDPGEIVAVLDCDPGCHGVQWGAQSGGGYFAYVSSKFSNALIVVDPRDGHNAEVVGKIVLAKEFGTEIDDPVIAYAGMGGQGVLTVPNVYEGWIQETVSECGSSPDPCSAEIVSFLNSLDSAQKDPLADGPDDPGPIDPGDGDGTPLAPPVITLSGDSMHVVYLGEDVYREPGALCVDSLGRSLPVSDNSAATVNSHTSGVYTITYSCTDSAANEAEPVTRTVYVLSPVVPTLIINGPWYVQTPLGVPYNDAGATCADFGDTDATLTTSSTVDTSRTGTYVVSYACVDADGNQAEKIRLVTVIRSAVPPA